MLQPRLSIPSVASESYMTALASTLNSLSLCATHSRLKPQPSLVLIRHASHATQGRANGPKDSAGRRLGAKKSASQYVIPGNIIFRQRGTKWFPGENVGMGKDHTIYSTVQGYVRYYVDPLKHPKRRYIGVALEREGRKSQLPTPPNAPSRRRLGMYSTPIKGTDDSQSFLEAHVSAESTLSATGGEELLEVHEVRASKPRSRRERREAAMARTAALYPPILRDDPSRRESNYSIGQTDLRKRGRTLKEFDRGDRWTAWHKRAKKVKAKVLARASKAARKTKGKKSNKVRAGGPGKRK